MAGLKDTLNPGDASTPISASFNWGYLVTAVVGIVWAVLSHYGYVSGPAPTP